MPTYTLCGTTIEVAKGGRTAKATRHVDSEGRPIQPPETRDFSVIAEAGAPTPQVQAERWAKGKTYQPRKPQSPPRARIVTDGE